MRRTITLLATAAILAPTAGRAQHVAGANGIKTIPAPTPLDPAKDFQAAFARVGDDVFIAGQPTADALRKMRERGVTTVVNLRTPEEMARVGFDEAALAASLGMKYVYLPVRGSAEMPYAPATVDQFARAMHDATGGVLLHCTVAWRASHLWAAYLIRERGVPVDTALAQARRINLMDDHHMSEGRQPVEDFLGRDLEALRRKTP
jgi:uncharacterized protein (TIGR01244 family)